MTIDERKEETVRLMALLAGSGDPLMITESGEVQAPDAQTTGEDEPCCPYCGVPLDDLDDGEGGTVDGEGYCAVCFVAVMWLSTMQVVCRHCRGKRLLWGLATAGEVKPTWYACEACQGRGWEPGHLVFDYDSDVGMDTILKVQHGALTAHFDPSREKYVLRCQEGEHAPPS
jgi:hypothetical protein